MLSGSVSWEVVVDVGMCISYPSSLTRVLRPLPCAGGREVLPDKSGYLKRKHDSYSYFLIPFIPLRMLLISKAKKESTLYFIKYFTATSWLNHKAVSALDLLCAAPMPSSVS